MRFWRTISVLFIVISVCYLAEWVQAQEGSGCTLDCDKGICEIDDNGDAYCLCDGRWGGVLCNESIICDQEEPCNGGLCIDGDTLENDFSCDCTGTNNGGTTCSIVMCEAATIEDLSEVGITAFFPSALAGELSPSNVTCSNGTFEGFPVASVVCNDDGMWSAPEVIDCNATLSDLTQDEQITTITVITSNQSTVDADVVGTVLDVMIEVNVTSADQANSLMTVSNNVLRSENAEGRDAIQSNAVEFLDAWIRYGREIIDFDSLYSNTESEFATIVPPLGTPASNEALSIIAAMISPRAGLPYSFSQPEVLWPEDKFAQAEFEFSSNVNTTYALYATVESENRVIFQAFHESDLLFDSDNVQSVVMSVQTSSETENFDKLEMKFYLFDYYTGLNSTEQVPDEVRGKLTFFCSNWDANEKTWLENNVCSVASITEVDLYNYVTCSCSRTGYFAITAREVIPEVDDPVVTNPGLSDGEIAGIVIGSVVGALLIIGLVVYCVKKKNKSKKVSSSKMSGFQHSSSDEDMELADKKSYSSGNKL